MALLQLILAKNVRYWRLWMCAKCRYSQETLQRGKRAKHKFTPAGDGLAESLSILLRDFLDLGFAEVCEDEGRGNVLVATALRTRIIMPNCPTGTTIETGMCAWVLNGVPELCADNW